MVKRKTDVKESDCVWYEKKMGIKIKRKMIKGDKQKEDEILNKGNKRSIKGNIRV